MLSGSRLSVNGWNSAIEGSRVEVVYRNTMALEALGGGVGAGDRAVKFVPEFPEQVDEKVRGAACAHPDDAAAFKMRGNVVQCRL